MREGFSGAMIRVAIAVLAVAVVISLFIAQASAQMPGASRKGAALRLTMSWGDPDLQGIWTDETDTPLQRSPKFANQEFFTEAQRAELDRQRSAMQGRERRAERGTVADVAGAYNDVFTPKKRTGARTSRIVDPPNGRLPPMTPEAQKIAAAEREFRLALLQATETCKNKESPCSGGKYDPTPSPRFGDTPPRYIRQRSIATMARRTLRCRSCLMGGGRRRAASEQSPIGSASDELFRRPAASRCSTT